VTAEIACFSCKKKWNLNDRLGRRDECPQCGEDAHVCFNCKFYDKMAYNECREPSADVVQEKSRANFCDFFEAGATQSTAKSATDLKAAAEALFKKG
jgi:hypothetical protein